MCMSIYHYQSYLLLSCLQYLSWVGGSSAHAKHGHLRTRTPVICTHRSWSSAHTKSRSSAHTAKGHLHTHTHQSHPRKRISHGVGWDNNVHFFCGVGGVGWDKNVHFFFRSICLAHAHTHEHWDGVRWVGCDNNVHVFFSPMCLAHANT